MLIILSILGSIPVFFFLLIKMFEVNANRRDREEAESETSCLEKLSLDYIAQACPDNFIGLRIQSREVVTKAGGRNLTFPFSKLRAITLTPIIETTKESTGETRTNRGSQLVGAGIGAAVAGPAGLVVGGLSGSQTSSSTASSEQHLADLELELLLRDSETPRVTLHAGRVGAFGNRYVTYRREQSFKNMAARLANIVEENTSTREQFDRG